MFDWFYRKKNNLSLQEVSSFEIEPVKKFALQGWKLGNILNSFKNAHLNIL